MNFQYKCARCGYCCLIEPCPIIRILDPDVGGDTGCGFLSFDGDLASCGISYLIPIGDGCCISARCFKDGVVYDFAALDGDIKRGLAQNLLKYKGVKYE